MKNEKKFIKYGKLLKGLIHNLNSPLMGLSGRIELLQMKVQDEKSFNQINSQLEKINTMLKHTAYLLDKDHTNSVMDVDISFLLENYFGFLYTDMRFKHQVEKELNFESHTINTNPSEIVNCLHDIIDYLLDYIDDESKLTVRNEKNIIYLTLQVGDKLSDKIDLDEFIAKNIEHKFHIENSIETNKVNVKIIL